MRSLQMVYQYSRDLPKFFLDRLINALGLATFLCRHSQLICIKGIFSSIPNKKEYFLVVFLFIVPTCSHEQALSIYIMMMLG
uniref:Uncharacterized protein n=1 Tax=Arundo donax TaxID=35708 RepID=A0A0A9B7A6_ARUDO